MEEEAGQISEQEKQERNEMLFTLSERDRGTLAMVIAPNEWKRKQLYQFLKERLGEYKFFDLDLTSHTYTSLYKALQELLPEPVLGSDPVQYLVSITGLESSLYKTEDGRIEFSSLISQLNFERELIFNQPYIILLWISEGFDKELQKKAPDLMHWMSKRFVFEDDGPDGMEVAEAAIEYGQVEKRGKIPEREERIHQLVETWEKLCLYHEDKDRLIKDKINLLRLLGIEYAAAFDLQKAEEAFQKAIGLNGKVRTYSGATLFYELGVIYRDFERYELALSYFQKSLDLAKQDGLNQEGIYHMMGTVYERMAKWKEAMESFILALNWPKKPGGKDSMANTYHHIGIVYQKQGKWGEALRSYKQALDSEDKTGELGSTYHQIGRVYEEQGKWREALQNYEQALETKERTGNEYKIGKTYYHIGRVYQKQGKWEKALLNYEQALNWHKKTGNEYEMGLFYYQVGEIYREQSKWDLALQSYEDALEWYKKAEKEYDVGFTYDRIGVVYQEQDKWEEALRSHEQALLWKGKAGPKSFGYTYLQLGTAYEGMGNLSTALSYYQKAVEDLTQYHSEYLPTAKQSLTRIQQKLNNQPPTPETP